MNSQSRMMMDALRNSMMAASEQPRAYAAGGTVSALPSLSELSNPNFRFDPTEFTNPFAPMTQNVPMSVIQGPAYGSMGTDVYDWKAPTAQAAPQPYSTVNMEAAQVYNRRVPTKAATVNVPMPSVATPTPNVPTDTYMPTMPGVTIPAAPVSPPPAEDIYYPAVEPPPPAAPVDTGFTPVTNPLGPTPEEVRRTEAAKELDALKAREEQERIAREAEAKRISDLQLAERQRQEQLNIISLENARVRDLRLAEEKRLEDLRLAEEKRIADEKAAQVVPVTTTPPAPVVEAAPAPERQWVTTNYDSGEGYYTEGAMSAEDAAAQQFSQDNSWYSGGGGE